MLDAAGRGHQDQVADLIAPLDVDEQIPANIHRSPGLREEQRAVPGAGERAELRVAR